MTMLADIKNRIARLDPDDLEAFRLWFLEFDSAQADEEFRLAVQESLDDPRPSVPAEEAFALLRRRYQDDTGD